MSTVPVSEDVLLWAIDRSGKTWETLEGTFPKIRKWVDGESQPTLRQLESFAKVTLTPFGFLFLDKPPQMRLPIRHFRTLEGEVPTEPSPNLLETVQTMQIRQAWMREFLIDQGQDRLRFIGCSQVETGPVEIARLMRLKLGLKEGWAREQSSWTEALGRLREAMEEVDVLVVVNGVVGNNNNRRLDANEFRGFVLVDDYAPLVFVNGADAKAAQMFTLAHELAHLFIGSSAAFDLREMEPADDPTEMMCNRAAAEFLVPADWLRRDWSSINNSDRPFSVIARNFKVSELVAARRALDLSIITKAEFLDFYHDYQGNERRVASSGPGGGDFYANQNFRIGRRFAFAVVQAVREGGMLYSEAYGLTGLYGQTFEKYAASLEIGKS